MDALCVQVVRENGRIINFRFPRVLARDFASSLDIRVRDHAAFQPILSRLKGRFPLSSDYYLEHTAESLMVALCYAAEASEGDVLVVPLRNPKHHTWGLLSHSTVFVTAERSVDPRVMDWFEE